MKNLQLHMIPGQISPMLGSGLGINEFKVS